MKAPKYVGVIILLLSSAYHVTAQCNQKVVNRCKKNIQNDSVFVMKEFNAKLKGSKAGQPPEVAKFSVVLYEGNLYRFSICNPSGFEGRAVLTLYSSRYLQGSTYNEYSGEDIGSFDFHCSRTAVYYVFISFKDGVKDKKGCAVGTLSYVKTKSFFEKLGELIVFVFIGCTQVCVGCL